MALLMGMTQVMLAQEAPKRKRAKMTCEAMDSMQCNRMGRELMLDDAATAKFNVLYNKFQKEWREGCPTVMQKKNNQSVKGDAAKEEAFKNRLAQQRRMLDLQEKYYPEFRKILSPEQINKLYTHKRGKGDWSGKPGEGKRLRK